MASARLPQLMDPDAAIFTISVAAQLAGMHPQTLRGYDRLGLVSPRRARGRGRRYSRRDIARLRLVQTLSQDEGINLPGIRRILELQDEVVALQRQLDDAHAALRAAADPSARVFTVDGAGHANLGRHRRALRELTA